MEKECKKEKFKTSIDTCKRVVIALGGNAIQNSNQCGTVQELIDSIRFACKQIVQFVKKGHQVILTHGNGPQIGNLLIQQEEAASIVPAQPLYCCGAMIQGQIGYLLQQELHNLFRKERINKEVFTVITRVLVDGNDFGFIKPNKPIGPFYDKETKENIEKTRGYVIKKVRHRSDKPFRRVVSSPHPLRILEAMEIKMLIESGGIVIASGGGGIPVAMNDEGDYYGVEAVIDKDLAAEKLAEMVLADVLLILTDVEKVYLNFDTQKMKPIDLISAEQTLDYINAGEFPPGSMGPKVESCVRFLNFGGERAIITSLEKSILAFQGKAGTHFVPNVGKKEGK